MAILIVGACTCSAQSQSGRPSALTLGLRQYTDHSDDPQSPFGDGDLSYLLAYEYHEAAAFWQFGLSYTPHATATSMVAEVESVLTPQIRLVFEESLLMIGVGALKNYVTQTDSSHWSDLYWELQLGLHAPISSTLDIRAVAFYTFKEWKNIDDFKSSQLEFGLEFAYRF